jgi:hypothetical protein
VVVALIRILAVVVAIVTGALVYAVSYIVALPLMENLFQSDAGTGEASSLLLAFPSMAAALVAGLATGVAGGTLSRVAGIAGGLILGASLLVLSAQIAPVQVDTNLPWFQRLVPQLGPPILAIFGAWVGEIIASLVTESLVIKLKRRDEAERTLRLYR